MGSTFLYLVAYAVPAVCGFVSPFAGGSAFWATGAASLAARAWQVSTLAPVATRPTANNNATAILALVRNMALVTPAASAAICEGITPAAVPPAATKSPDRIGM